MHSRSSRFHKKVHIDNEKDAIAFIPESLHEYIREKSQFDEEELRSKILDWVPQEYHDLPQTFSKCKSDQILTH